MGQPEEFSAQGRKDGDGKNVRMECPIQSGTYAFPNGSCSLANAAVVIEVGMEWVPEPGQVSFVVSGNDEITAITTEMNEGKISTDLAKEFANHNAPLGDSAKVTPAQPGRAARNQRVRFHSWT